MPLLFPSSDRRENSRRVSPCSMRILRILAPIILRAARRWEYRLPVIGLRSYHFRYDEPTGRVSYAPVRSPAQKEDNAVWGGK